MRLLFLLAQRHWTGAAEPVLQLADGLAARGHRVFFIYTRRPPGHLAGHIDEQKLGVAPNIELVRKGFHPFAMLGDALRLKRLIAREKIDAVFCHQSHDHWLGWWAATRQPNPPILVRQIHESRQLRGDAASRFLIRHTDAVIVASRHWKQTLMDRSGLDPSRIHVLPPAVDTARFAPRADTAAIRAEVGAAPDDKLIGIVSRIKPGRGHDLALEAFIRVRRETPRARLLIVGRGEGKEALEAQVRERGQTDRVHFLGYRTDDLPAIFSALDVSLLLGEGSDGSCRAALESMACGTPVVALPVGTLPETLTDGEQGLFVENDPESLAAGILELLSLPELRLRARGHAERSLSLTHRVDTAEKIFADLLEVR